MYTAFYGLKREPFSISPDPHFLFMSEAHREALAHLLYGVKGGGGFVVLTGEIGAGKTTVCRCFLDQVPADCDVAYVFNPKLSVAELLRTVCEEFRIELPSNAHSVKDFVDPLNRFLLASHAAGRHSVLIIDEAQSLSADLLEQLRLLTNLETAERKLLQIVLIGQPELRTMLARPDLEQLAQRITARYHLPALSEAESALYVRHRLQVAGLGAEQPFDAGALRRIHALCRGVPRRINLLCDRALLGGYAGGRQRIQRATVEQAAREVFGSHHGGALPARATSGAAGWALGAAGVLVALAVTLALWWAAQPGAVAPAADVAALPPPAISASAVPVSPASSATPPTPPVDAATAALAVPTPASAALPAPAGAASAAPVAPADSSGMAIAPTPAGAAEVLAAAQRSEAVVWRELATLWPLQLAEGESCEVVAREQAACWRSNLGLASLRTLGRPGVLTLYAPPSQPGGAPASQAVHVLIVALADDSATLRLDGRDRVVPLPVLASLWRGDFGTFWRTPPGYRESAVEPSAELLAWLEKRLPEPASTPLVSRVQAFQVARGLRPDGLAGPMTLMQIQGAHGSNEPRLRIDGRPAAPASAATLTTGAR
jgi:general secretion pathway protein A